MKVKFLIRSTVADRVYEAGEIGNVAGISAEILFRKGRAERVDKAEEEKSSKTTKANKEA